ncbi:MULTISPECIES: hypothetical protein [Alicyclobacillus]|uniref:Uncharacterized protein n=1 Tax=Alicyclobacillus acidoterrestris (strain ATCC 49025 / DSM 3922 / CIP 106132 / NCIMB 13137 / GD3B) TaxID=1356854 RepID=T0BVW6_ALIAG|nr:MULTISPECIES: hypothetical protein [Alicyclobacillus]EPZ48248.1 hypothetical protein N007_00585 [Alicyclobacillus acidoterrestris ATCC 49025]UNO50430.1 hypothetical protein K1I37_08165 [Alicyclobacillus acidoterrestris]
MVTHRHVREYLGKHVHLHTRYGSFEGVIVHLNRHHIILGHVPVRDPQLGALPMSYFQPDEALRQMPLGPGGPPVPPPGGGGGWHIAIPLAAIIGITAIGMHWW